MLLKPNGKKLQGFGGCNRILGGYETKDDSIRFKAATTMMACVDGMETEQEFLKALEATTSFNLSGEELELFNNDRLLVRFRAVWLK
jgi:heat shock protein HslJ